MQKYNLLLSVQHWLCYLHVWIWFFGFILPCQFICKIKVPWPAVANFSFCKIPSSKKLFTMLMAMAIFISKYLPKLNQILELDTLFMY